METTTPMLRITYSASAGALYVQLRDADASRTMELAENVYLDVADDGAPVGIEFVDAGDFFDFVTRQGGEFAIPA